MVAVNKRQTAAADWLLQHGVAVNAVDKSGCTALHIACESNSSESNTSMVELLLANGADIHKCTNEGCTALDIAVNNGNLQHVKVLIAAGADVNHRIGNNMTTLHIAIMSKHATIVQLLLEHGATAVINTVVDIQGIDVGTALMLFSDADTVKALLAAGADVHVRTNKGDTCLHKAVKQMIPVPLICLLIKADADLHAVNYEGKTAAQIAHDKGRAFMYQLLNRATQQLVK
jgi:uncharacterized protein